jgi:hypothetical protein
MNVQDRITLNSVRFLGLGLGATLLAIFNPH